MLTACLIILVSLWMWLAVTLLDFLVLFDSFGGGGGSYAVSDKLDVCLLIRK